MDLSDLVPGSLPLLAALGVAALLAVLLVVRAASGKSRWSRISAIAVVGVVLALSLGLVLWQREQTATRLRIFERMQESAESNLLADTLTVVDTLTSTVPTLPPPASIVEREGSGSLTLEAQHYLASHVVPVQAGQRLRYSLSVAGIPKARGEGNRYQVRLVWYNKALSVIAWDDSPQWASAPILDPGATEQYLVDAFRTAEYEAPPGASYTRLEVRNIDTNAVLVRGLKLSATGAYVEQHPNGARGSVAFSFDWETAMGGPIHSRGMGEHDVASASRHGLQMRQGADWLARLFQVNNVQGTFYAVGYNFLDGNSDRRTFSGDPIYRWASTRNRWSSDYWLTHKWFGDDPYGTVQSAPEWYFGDQTRSLLRAGHEIGSHTFGHLYVRGSNPEELATDLDEWLATSQAVGVPPPTTFAFPWRSSNSLTPNFYDVLYSRGIRAVTRLYERDLRDLYTVSAVPTYTQMLVMPDFRLEAPTSNVVEEAAGEIIGLERGTQVLDEVVARRGTTSFWTHPEQLADSPDFEQVRSNWRGVVSEAAARRDMGLLWIGTVAEIIAYQGDVMSVTTSLDPGFLGMGDWTLEVRNDSGHDIKGLTLTLPAEAANASSTSARIATARREGDRVVVSPAGQPTFPARQLVLESLPPGKTRITIAWVAGQEPPR